ncbi:MAG: HAMP domain-containing protein, partial [Zetaproteobacteria bacterium]|nr:HAMP domain-containing protein [Zetaproteobacteria bacterium]
MLRFFSQSISRKIIFLVCAVLVFSQVVSFVITFSQISASQERSIEDSFLRIKLLVTTLFETETAKLASQAQMVGTQPVLMAVTGSEDEETIQDSSSEYAGRFQLDFFDILSIDGEPYGEAGGAWDTAALDFFIQAIEEGQLISGYALRERKLAFVAAAPIGLLPNHTGYLILGNYVKDQIAEDIAEIANSDISFLAENEIIATSLAKDEAGMELRRQFMQELQQAGAEAVNGFRNQDYIFKQTVLKGVQGKPLASFVVQSSLAETQQFFYRMLLILLAVSLVVVSVFGLMSAHLARTISTPILALERLAKDVISSLNFGLRAQPVGNDEVCSLAESFNHLLQEIEENHSKLEEYSKNLEK